MTTRSCLLLLIIIVNAFEALGGTCPTLDGRWTRGSARAVAVSGTHAYLGSGASLLVVDLTEPSTPSVVGEAQLPFRVFGLAVYGDYVVVGTVSSVYVLDVTDPTSPIVVGSFDGTGYDVVVTGDVALVSAWSSGLRALDLSDPTDPHQIGVFDSPGSAYGAAVSGNLVFLADGDSGLRILEIAASPDPDYFNEIGFLTMSEDSLAVEVAGDQAYVVGNRGSLEVVDVSDPAAPAVVGSMSYTYNSVESVDVVGSVAFIAVEYLGLQIVDFSNPSSPVEVASFSSPGEGSDIVVSEGMAYLADGYAGLRLFDVSGPTAGPTEVASLPMSRAVSDIEVVGDLAFLAADGLRVVDITDPENPSEIGFLEFNGPAESVAVSGTLAVVSVFNVLHIVDVSDPELPTELGLFEGPDPSFVWGIAFDGRYAYLACGVNGFRIIDAGDPGSPVEVGFLPITYTAVNVEISGNLAFVAAEYGGLQVIDISDPSAPVEVGNEAPWWDVLDVAISGNLVMVVGEYAQLRIYDFSDPSALVKVGMLSNLGVPSNVEVYGTRAYISGLWGASGCRIVDISNPAIPVEIERFSDSWRENSAVPVGDHVLVGYGDRLAVVSVPEIHREVGVLETLGWAKGIAVDGNYVYLATDPSGLHIVDVSDPSTPVAVGRFKGPWAGLLYPIETHDVEVALTADDTLFLAQQDAGLLVVDVADPKRPVQIGAVDIRDPTDIALTGSLALVASSPNGGMFRVFDVSNAANPVEIGSYLPQFWATAVTVVDDLVYVAAGPQGMHVVDISDPTQPVQVGIFNASVNDVEVVDSTAYLTGDHLLRVLDVSDPVSPIELGSCEAPAGSNNSLIVSGNFVFVEVNVGVAVVDVSDPTMPLTRSYTDPIDSPSGLAILGESLYSADWWQGFRVFDVSPCANALFCDGFESGYLGAWSDSEL